MNDRHYMEMALDLARKGEGFTSPNPMVGAVVVQDNKVVGSGYHEIVGSPHAEVNAIDEAGEFANGATLYVTLEPCVMCAGAIIHARVKRVVIGAPDPKTGAAGSVFNILNSDRHNHQVEISQGVLAEECGALLKEFFQARRNKNT